MKLRMERARALDDQRRAQRKKQEDDRGAQDAKEANARIWVYFPWLGLKPMKLITFEQGVTSRMDTCYYEQLLPFTANFHLHLPYFQCDFLQKVNI